MAWNSPGGGGGGPWGGGGNGGGGPQGPWGNGPSGKGPQPPDLDDMIRQGQDRLKRMMPGGGGTGSLRGLFLILLIAVGVWGGSGFYRVQPGEQGVELLFGKYFKTTSPGLNYWFPAPVGQVLRPDVERTNELTIGFRKSGNVERDVPQESLMLTGDQNIADVDFIVQWRIKDAPNFLFNIRDPEATVKLAAESAIREVVGKISLERLITKERQIVQAQTQQLLQEILDSYGAGVFVADVKLQKTDPPQQVIEAFNDVQRARQDKERQQNEAEAYRNDIVPRARGEAARMIQDARAYKERLINEAEGEAKRFLSVLAAYEVDKDVTKTRLYLERMQDILNRTEKVIVDSKGGSQGVLPYLPLPELKKSGGK